ncbi:hypothetical protein [Flavobacterium sp. UMI-01]|uniref:hypothetical protein n=1 Tax=Flavobacterium sp. UMI-01 TaxID=1441053 RepID=UPI001C7D1611|nr:hypothetical protein [Flavobacterium sp. UMI-01]GIZ10017.1 hypothetical protein FUMI01_27430 [Flavobacterium sp. UMI-01]
MNKSKTKIYNSYDSDILEALFQKYGVTKYYIRQCICGNKQGVTPDSIKKDYKIMLKANEQDNEGKVQRLIDKTLEK